MAALDITGLLAPISAAAPSGADPEYHPDFIAMAQAAEGRPERVMGTATVTAEPPDWRKVAQLARQLWTSSHDLRIAIYLTRAELNLRGFAGLADGLQLLRGLLELHWDSVHPQLDPADANDPTFRLNTLAALCDSQYFLREVASARLAAVKGLGDISLRDVQIARGELEVPLDPKRPAPDSALIAAIFAQCPQPELAACYASVATALAEAKNIDRLLIERVGTSQSIALEPLIKLLSSALALLTEHGSSASTAPDDAAETGARDEAPATTGPVRSRAHAVALMDEIAAYFREHEPSSPVPLFMERAKRLTSLGFLDILQDIAPDGLKQARVFSSPEQNKT